jgi:hypothetical protein
VAVGRGTRQAEGGSRILDPQPGEVPQFDHPRGDWILGGKPGEGRIQGEQLFIHDLGLGRDVGQLDPATVAAVLFGALTTGSVHQNAAHGFRSGRSILPGDYRSSYHPRGHKSSIFLARLSSSSRPRANCPAGLLSILHAATNLRRIGSVFF